jgi:hypothetical protein
MNTLKTKVLTAQSTVAKKRRLWLYLLLGFWLWAMLFQDLRGNFPLNDDWCYGLAIKGYLENGELIMAVTSAPAFLAIAVGTLVCKIFGFSYTYLRCVNFSFAFASSIFLFFTLRNLGLKARDAGLFSLCYAANPLLQNVSTSFMTDASALFCLCGYSYYAVRTIKKYNTPNYLATLLFALAAIFSRQSFLLFALAIFWIFPLKTKEERLKSLFLSAFSYALFFLAFSLADQWVLQQPSYGADYQSVKVMHGQFFHSLITTPLPGLGLVINSLALTLGYLGLAGLPITLCCLLPSLATSNGAWLSPVSAAFLALFSYWQTVLKDGRLMPFSENILRFNSLGAQGIMGLAVSPLGKHKKFWLTLATYGCQFILGTVLLATIFRAIKLAKKTIKAGDKSNHRRLQATGFSLTSLALVLAFLTIETSVRCTDRYYLMAMPTLLMVLAFSWRWFKAEKFWPCLLLLNLALASYSLAANTDWLNWNRARWLLIQRLEAKGVTYKTLDGGAEYNIFHDLNALSRAYKGEPPRDTWRWWPVAGENYIISFSPIPGFDVIDQEKYFNPLLLKEGRVLTLKKSLSNIQAGGRKPVPAR